MRPLIVAREHSVAKSVLGSLANDLRLISIIHIFGHYMPFLAILCPFKPLNAIFGYVMPMLFYAGI